jgi:aerobic-type carbon monoxide dehydrogenase small subunit (CoxS/CutS family)
MTVHQATSEPPTVSLEINGDVVHVEDRGWTLLDVLRHELGLDSVKDGCAPQGQCGCCTVLVDGQPRVACVTPARRVRGRSVVTLEGLDPARRAQWAEALCSSGGSQCGFCTPGIIMRLDPLLDAEAAPTDADLDQALLAHLCRCTGWQTIKEAAAQAAAEVAVTLGDRSDEAAARDLDAAGTRATLEGRADQRVAPAVALGGGGFAADTVPDEHLVAVLDAEGSWVVADTLPEARFKAGKVQGRRTTAPHQHPIEVPDGEWQATLRTTWVDGAYLETDAAWCRPGQQPTTLAAANGGAFGAKPVALDLPAVAQRLADEHGQTVLAVASREDVARHSPKRPPLAAGIRAEGTGIVRVAATPGIADAIAAVAPGLVVEQVEVPGPPTSAQVRAAGWAEAMVLLSAAASIGGPVAVERQADSSVTATVTSPEGADATAQVWAPTGEGRARVEVSLRCGPILDAVVLRSYCIGAAHMAWSWLTSEAMLVDEQGTVHDLTVRSLGVVRAVDTPTIDVDLLHPADESEPAVNGSDAVFVAVAVAGWHLLGRPANWPTDLPGSA